MGAKTLQQAHVWICLDGIADLEALREGLAQGLATCRDILHKVDIARRSKALGDVYEDRVHRGCTPPAAWAPRASTKARMRLIESKLSRVTSAGCTRKPAASSINMIKSTILKESIRPDENSRVSSSKSSGASPCF